MGIDFICADMNSDHLAKKPSGPYMPQAVSRPVHMAFEQGYTSALHHMHPRAFPISHTCSYAQDGCVDYVLFRDSPLVKVVQAYLYPEILPPDTEWCPTTGWGENEADTISDHRPLFVDFTIQACSP